MRFAKPFLVLALLALTSCASLPFDTGIKYTVYGKLPIDPVPEMYETIAGEVKLCVQAGKLNGFPGPFHDVRFSRVRWYSADRITREDGVVPAGMSEANELWIILNRGYTNDAEVIFHEWLHLETYPVTHGQGVFLYCDPFKVPRGVR